MGWLKDTIGVAGVILSWKRDRTDDKATAAWNAYDRQVDMFSLDALITHTESRIGVLTETAQLSANREALLGQQVTILGNRAVINRHHAMEEAHDHRWRSQRQFEVTQNALAQRSRELDLMGAQIAAGRRLIVAERIALEKNTGARGRVLDAEISQALLERQLFSENQASQVRLYDSMGRVLDAEETELRMSQPEREREIAARLAAIEANARLVGTTEAFALAQANEDAVLDAGEAAASQASRGLVGSFGQTEGIRIARERARSQTLTRMGADARRAGLDAQGAAAIRDRETTRRQTTSALARVEHRRTEVAEGRTGLGREARAFSGRYDTAQAQFAARRTELEQGLAVGQERLRGRSEELTGQEGVLGARRRGVTIGRRQAIDEKKLANKQATRMEREAAQTYAEDQYAVSQARLAVDEQGIRTRDLAGQIKDAETAKAIADWQKEKLPTLPLGGSSRSVVSLGLAVASELID